MLNNRHRALITFADQQLQFLASGACYWPAEKTLIVSDLHLEKGSYFASRGHPVPISDTRYTLETLQQELVLLQPRTVICLGDNIHDQYGFERMEDSDLDLLQSLCNSVENWLWVIGNHDKINKNNDWLLKEFVPDITISSLFFSHELQKDKPFQIIGHYHPKISIKKQSVKISGKCFINTSNILILPAFGSYTGGLDIESPVFNKILNDKKSYYMIHKNNIFFVK